MQLQVMNSPFNQEQAELLNQILPTLTETQKIWLSGYLTASYQPGAAGTVSQQKQAPAVVKELTILFGSQTGNARGIAEKAGQTFEAQGFTVNVSSMSEFKPNQLKKVQNLLIAVSTHGEGEPPDNALSFYEFLHGRRAPKLEGLRFSVLSLGDSSYEQFCQTGKDFDQRLEELGGTRIYPRVDCDLDYDEPAAEWIEGTLEGLRDAEEETGAPDPLSAVDSSAHKSDYSRTNPFVAEVLENINLNGRGSDKETRHIELSLEGSGLTYEPGDSLGIFPKNDPEYIDRILSETNWNPEEFVTVNKQGDTLSLKEALTSYFETTGLTKPLLEKVADLTESEGLKELLAPGNEEKLKAYREGRDLLDLIRDYGVWGSSSQEFVSVLRKMPARLYSISSSLAANPEEVHVTIGALRYEAHGRKRNGVCSILCAERLQPGDTLPVYIQSNSNFKLPEDPETPIIMVGPGTGVAPFRSFMQEREEIGAEGKSWMFFGDQHFVTDFLYQTEWQKWLKEGVLSKMDVAFSRDTEQKVYVQDRMLEHSRELFEWIKGGAVVYVCGDEKNMARDVNDTLIKIIESEGGMSSDEAAAYLSDMQTQKRYQRDVY